ncbi:MAG TPA: hypothetical protein VIP46_02810 [Pyrinomonadaceae bacterium]
MKADERIAARQAALLEMEAAVVRELRAACHDLEAVKEENRALRAERLRRERRFYTEAEVAEQLHVSIDTVRRLRKEFNLEHLRPCATEVLYTEEQRDALAEVITKNRRQPPSEQGLGTKKARARRYTPRA